MIPKFLLPSLAELDNCMSREDRRRTVFCNEQVYANPSSKAEGAERPENEAPKSSFSEKKINRNLLTEVPYLAAERQGIPAPNLQKISFFS